MQALLVSLSSLLSSRVAASLKTRGLVSGVIEMEEVHEAETVGILPSIFVALVFLLRTVFMK